MGRRGQVTLFIILGIVILIVIGVISYSYSKSSKTITPAPDDIDSIKQYSQACLTSAAKNVISKVHEQGGYYDITNIRTERINNRLVPYYFYQGIKAIPTEASIANEISNGIKLEFEPCMAEGIKYYKTIGWKFDEVLPIEVETAMKTSTSTWNTVILVKATYPTKVSKGTSVYTIGKLDYTADSRIGIFLAAATICTNEWLKYPDFFSIRGCMMEKKDYYTISNFRKELPYYFEYQDAVAKKENNDVYWRYALTP